MVHFSACCHIPLIGAGNIPHLEKCNFDDECDYCKSPEDGTYASTKKIPMENEEADFYICGKCAHGKGWLSALVQPNPQDHPGPSGPRVHPVVGRV
jgi:hypothetical protein